MRDQRDIQIEDGAPPGDYRLVVGLYEPNTGDRLPLLDEEGTIQGDSVQLDMFQVAEP